MPADTDSKIAWHRTQLKRHREALKDLETARFTSGEIADSKSIGRTQKTLTELKRKITQSERIIADYEKQTRRPRATDYQSLANVSWSNWNARTNGIR
jgi:hypothetical protein